MPQIGDAFGRMLWDYHAGQDDVDEIIEREDGYIDSGPARRYFAEPRDWPPHERDAMKLVRGRVLDIGAGAGRHALYLQERGHDVTAIDPSSLSAKVCRARGLEDVRNVPLSKLPVSEGPFDTVIMLGNNFGVLESPKEAVRQLRRLARMTSARARILAGTNNVYNPKPPREHRDYQAFCRSRGRMSGQLRLRVRYRNLATPWFDCLMVSPMEMKTIAGETPWRVDRLLQGPAGLYVAVLVKRP